MACAGTGCQEGTGPSVTRWRGYRAPLAQRRARHPAGTAQQPARQDPQGLLGAMVERLLRERHSPEQIAG
ncbi:MAG: hypothetical protein VB125_04100 [Burkholderia sp.]